jgi:hypothetical protein
MINKLNNKVFEKKVLNSTQSFYFFGMVHTNNPDDSQFNSLKEVWSGFLKNKSRKEIIVFTEGTIRTAISNFDDSVIKFGESGGIQWLAKEAKIECVCPEPNNEEQRRDLCVRFDSNSVAYSMIVQNLSSWYRHADLLSFNEILVKTIEREAKFSDIYGFSPDIDWFNDYHKKIFGKRKIEDRLFLDSISDPRKDDTLINKIISLRTELRNKRILHSIIEAWKSGKSIFIVYGKGHLDILEDPLKKLLK